MSKQYKERVQIGSSLDGKPIYKWASGYSIQEFHMCIAKLMLESGMLGKPSSNEEQRPIMSPTFQKYAESWVKVYKVPKLRHTTLMTYQNLLKKHIYPFFGNKRLDTITLTDVQKFYNQNAKLAKSSVRQMAIILHQIFDMAVEDGYMKRNLTESKRLFYSGTTEKKRNALSDDEVRSIVENLYRLEGKDRLPLALLLFTGMRRGETIALRWENIDWKRRLISVEKNVTFHNNQPVIGETKSSAGRRKIPLDKRLAEILSLYRQLNGFILGDGIKPLTERTFTRTWQRIAKTINLYGATPHVFRHTYITLAASTDIDIKTLQSIAGHSDIRMTLDRYAHGREEKIIEAGNLISNAFDAIR